MTLQTYELCDDLNPAWHRQEPRVLREWPVRAELWRQWALEPGLWAEAAPFSPQYGILSWFPLALTFAISPGAHPCRRVLVLSVCLSVFNTLQINVCAQTEVQVRSLPFGSQLSQHYLLKRLSFSH